MQISKTKQIVLIAILLINYSTIKAQTKHSFTITQTVEYASKNNAQVKNALLGILAQEQVNREVTANAYPTIGADITVNNNIVVSTQVIPGDMFGQPGQLVPVKFGIKYNSNAMIQLRQLLFDGQVFVGLQARKASMEFAKKNAEVVVENIKVNIYKIYYQLVVSKTQIELLNTNIERIEKLKHDANQLYINGFAEKLDVDKIDVTLTNLKTERVKALNNIEIGYLGLKTLIGMPLNDTLELTDKITDNDIKQNALTDSINFNDRKDFQYLQTVKKLNEYNIKRYKLSYLPTVAISGVYGKQAYRQKFTFLGKGDWFDVSNIGLNISIPIFSGFARDSKIKQTKIELQQTENNIGNLKLAINNEVESAKLRFNSAIESMDFQKKNMQLAETVYNQTKKKFEAGTGSNTEINAAHTDLKTAQTNYITSLYDAIIAKVDFLKATGKL
ncbi:MAG TPA: TolC family protein [Chitinophagaceae bacterium]|nr:TolC family protein [Chitinophagaceae bacterium]HNF30365.1 TolC family protein [Chitinophagaceae bacterium]HNJ57579.1 TolC family protein [Chitinophagaceae bacterium]HNM33955.1 TolC family protein [Chitinophagaceae bacterium]HNN32192.1 TolC family protein [Chitinophagaceae bacterium]